MKSFKKLNGGKSAIILLSGALAILSGCSGNENLYDADYVEKQYTANWENTIGSIDPDQTWNMAEAKTLSITASESGLVTIYTKDTDETYILGKAVVTSGTTTMKFDVPADVTEVYAVLSADGESTCKVVSVSADAASVSFSGTKASKATVESLSPVERRKIDYVNGLYCPDNLTSYFTQVYDADEWGDFYATSVWPLCTSGHNQYYWGDKTMSTDCEHVDMDTAYPQLAAITKTLNDAESNKNLEEYAQNISYTTTQDGEIVLTKIAGTSSANCAIGYFYTPAGTEETEAILKAAPKYVVIPATQGISAGDRFRLTYYGKEGTGTPSFTFPEGTNIHFFLARSYDYVRVLNPDHISFTEGDNTYDYYCLDAYLQFYSDKDLSTTACNKAGWDVIQSTAAFNTAGLNVIAFEDWPEGNINTDWNDAAFVVEGVLGDFDTIDKDMTWTLAYEDLGSTDDFDFNDVVLRVSKTTTETYDNRGTLVNTESTITAQLCAAGGTLPTHVYYGSEDLGEVHSLFGVSTATMVNTGNASADIVTLIEKRAVDNDFTISDYARQFSIVVSGDTERTLTLPSETGTAPQAICIPTAWKWPTERTNISDAYAEFGAWGANYTTSKSWYVTPSDESLVVEK